MKRKNHLFYFALVMALTCILATLQFCSKKQKDNITTLPVINREKNLSESYKKTGWLDEGRYRAVVYIITLEECKNSPENEIHERIKLEAYKHLHKELNPAFNRNASVKIKSLIEKYGRVIAAGKSCIESNIYFFDLEKNDLKADFINIKNIK
ncbi:MAG TPA: hypothetical protein PK358_10935 [Spirochaetota bacterium]|nr:hypothetical protein [Spirochaetota bacterium]HPJ35342.1 hypothetical protein [Spirochaetota bacterium]